MVIKLTKERIEIYGEYGDLENKLYLCLDKNGKFDLRDYNNDTLIAIYHEKETEIDKNKRITYIGMIDTFDNRVKCRMYLFWDIEGSIHLVATAKNSGQTMIHRIVAVDSYIPVIKSIIYNEFDIGDESVLNFTDNPPSGFEQRYEDSDYFMNCYDWKQVGEDEYIPVICCENCGSENCEIINRANCSKNDVHSSVSSYVKPHSYEHNIDYDKLNIVLNEEKLKKPLQTEILEVREAPGCSKYYNPDTTKQKTYKFFSDIWDMEYTIDEILFNAVRFYQSTYLYNGRIDELENDLKMIKIGNEFMVYNKASLSINYNHTMYCIPSYNVNNWCNLRNDSILTHEGILRFADYSEDYIAEPDSLGYYTKTYESDNGLLFDLYCALKNGEIVETIVDKKSGKVISKCRLTKNNTHDYIDFGINLAGVNEIDKVYVNDKYILFVNKEGILTSYCDVNYIDADDAYRYYSNFRGVKCANVDSIFDASYEYLYGKHKAINIQYGYNALFNIKLFNTVYTVGLECNYDSSNVIIKSDNGETIPLDGSSRVIDCMINYIVNDGESIPYENFKFSYELNEDEDEDKTKGKHDRATKKLDLF